MKKSIFSMKNKIIFFLVLFLSIIWIAEIYAAEDKLDILFFFSSGCKHCIDIEEQYLPGVISKYKDKIAISYFNIAEPQNLKLLLAIEKKFDLPLRTPTILIGHTLLVGAPQIRQRLEPLIDGYLARPPPSAIQMKTISLLQKFHSFSPHLIIAAGLIDGINPCAFTVIIFFISFLTLMGYKKADMVIIGSAFIFAVFCTYVAIGCGLFRGLYELKKFSTIHTIAYWIIAAFCFILAYLNLRDFIVYIKTKNPDELKVKLPKPIRMRINAIIGLFYRKGQKDAAPGRLTLLVSALVVGFLVSLLEAVCTGQVYVPTIVFILSEPALRMRAIAYLLLYNFMFVVPLIIILCVALIGTGSKTIENFFKNKIALVKFLMFLLFLGLGIFLLIGVLL